MERRFTLGSGIENLSSSAITPTVTFANGGKEIEIKFSIKSKAVPNPIDPNDPDRDTCRDLFERASGSLYGANLKISVFAIGKNASTMQINMDLNSKIPGTGAGAARALEDNGINEPIDYPEKK